MQRAVLKTQRQSKRTLAEIGVDPALNRYFWRVARCLNHNTDQHDIYICVAQAELWSKNKNTIAPLTQVEKMHVIDALAKYQIDVEIVGINLFRIKHWCWLDQIFIDEKNFICNEKIPLDSQPDLTSTGFLLE
jgi:hypothetical protein